MVEAAHVDAAAGGDAVGDDGHLLGFLLSTSLRQSSDRLHGASYLRRIRKSGPFAGPSGRWGHCNLNLFH